MNSIKPLSESPAQGPYDDIINLPHHQSKVHQPMSPEARAAQFAPFAALNGHAVAIEQTASMHISSVNNPVDTSADFTDCDLY